MLCVNFRECSCEEPVDVPCYMWEECSDTRQPVNSTQEEVSTPREQAVSASPSLCSQHCMIFAFK